MMTERKIIHIDMDAFYASVEQRDQPELRGRPVLVGGRPESRGVVAACSYEARRFGIHSAMSSARAARLCPKAVFVPPRFDVYREVSQQIRGIFYEHTELVEPLSLDEAYLDVTSNKKQIASATWIAEEIRATIWRETQLTASAGVSYNKFLAKVASDVNKPNGLTVVTPAQAEAFLTELPIRRFHGVGKVTESKMKEHGILNGGDLRRRSEEELVTLFGKAGRYFYRIVRGVDTRSVQPNRIRKSISKETTLSQDCSDRDEMIAILTRLAERLEEAMALGQSSGVTLTLKVKYADFQHVTRSMTHSTPYTQASLMIAHASQLLDKTEAGSRPIRLLGLGVSNLLGEDNEETPSQQLSFSFVKEQRSGYYG
ncbi:MAG: DNA polymerase IV [Deltaproteobacteria bacterium]|nr:MAG: DNA polymerase IV [Deltaproteobacteria bacterium]